MTVRLRFLLDLNGACKIGWLTKCLWTISSGISKFFDVWENFSSIKNFRYSRISTRGNNS